MGFAEEVAAASTSGSSIGHVAQVLNALPAKERTEIVKYLDNLPAGVQKVAVARALTKRAAAVGLSVKVNGGQVSSFISGNRNGLEA